MTNTEYQINKSICQQIGVTYTIICTDSFPKFGKIKGFKRGDKKTFSSIKQMNIFFNKLKTYRDNFMIEEFEGKQYVSFNEMEAICRNF